MLQLFITLKLLLRTLFALLALPNILIIRLLDLQQQWSKVLIPLDDFIESLGEGLKLFGFVEGCFFEADGELLFQVHGVGGEEALVSGWGLLLVLKFIFVGVICHNRAWRESQNLMLLRRQVLETGTSIVIVVIVRGVKGIVKRQVEIGLDLLLLFRFLLYC